VKTFETICPWLREPLVTIEAAAGRDRLGHGWLISGPADIGKRDLVYVLASRLLHGRTGTAIPGPASPAEIVARYAELDEVDGWHPDLHRVRVEEGKLSIAVDQVRAMTASLALTPHVAGLKIVVIESAERMTTEAANALLKSLEEPTPDTYLFLLAERPGRLPATIRSRCQRLTLKSPARAATLAWLEDAGLADALPAALSNSAPLTAARAAMDDNNLRKYNDIYNTINEVYRGRGDPYAIAERWDKGDTALALDCLVESLRARIRRALVPERSTPVTDPGLRFNDNSGEAFSSEALFEGLQMAENLREQLGRGIKVDLALKALLLGLEPSETSRVQR
jgi:DNA polymerase III subunit delta'